MVAGIVGTYASGVVAWRRPTLPCLETQYHGRWSVSRPCSGWERVWQLRDGHQATRPDAYGCVEIGSGACARFGAVRGAGLATSVRCCVVMEFYRVIRTARLNRLPGFYLRPIDVVVYHGP